MTFVMWLAVVGMTLYVAGCFAVYMLQEKFIFFPTKLPEDYFYRFPIAFEEYDIEVEGDTSLNALLFKTDMQSKGCVLYHHGNARSVVDWGGNAHDFTSRGYDVLFYDYRGYGKSDGVITSEKQLVDDAKKVYEWLLKKYPSDHIIQMGRSLGSGIAVQLAALFPTPKLILETPYSSVFRIAQRTIPFIPNSIILKYKFWSINHIKKVDTEIVLIHGTDDTIIPFKHSKRLLKRNKRAKLMVIEGGEHNNLPSFEKYQEALDQILN